MKNKERQKLRKKELHLKGSPICAGIAVGRAFLFTVVDDVVSEFQVAPNDIEDEIKRFRSALQKSREEIQYLQKQLETEGALDGINIMDTHLEILQDGMMTANIEEEIRQKRKNTESILRNVVKTFEARFNQIQDNFFRERFKDIQDVSRRILGHLKQSVRMSLADIPSNSVVFAHELSPSDTAEAKSFRVEAFVTEAGGETSHAAIMAKAKGIPYVSSVNFSELKKIRDSQVIIDGRTGDVIINPSKATLSFYKDLQKQLKSQTRDLEKVGNLSAETLDGYAVRLSANIETHQELDMLHDYGGHGVGLFRSEFLFLSHDTFPGEEEQFEAYKKIIEKMRSLPIVIRTFDVGGDKFSHFHHKLRTESNPFLGCRAVRLMLKEKKIFETQLRAILRASFYGDISILFPMISGLPELIQIKQLISDIKKELSEKGIPYKKNIPIGCMIEVPSAAITCDVLARECDFLSIGTNDLVQYSLAVDRSNQDMSHLYNPTDPSVIRLIKMIVTVANRNGIPVGICGEIAANPRFTALLLGLGIHELSVASRYLPVVKNVIRSISVVSAVRLAEKVLNLPTALEVQEMLISEYQKTMPHDSMHTAKKVTTFA